jgi:hypothetical protein
MSIAWKCMLSNYKPFIVGAVSPLQALSELSLLPELAGQMEGVVTVLECLGNVKFLKREFDDA